MAIQATVKPRRIGQRRRAYYQNGPPTVIGAFDFAYVAFAVLWGVVFFADVPDLASAAGMALIVGAGILSLRQ
ncbi:hypothetical protein [Frigidibacter mobilis]|uniref:EamA-like transporter family protein n=1 Tax=Frigidibacter mobilis TaxID=1335048 RepID=A0A159Z507_9RHOB|nr:hypothetical protein [Frigidibacter mobilis]AMY70291.1 hypothetical protein AKL17_3058 [Frigidibacter mobilis]